MTVLRALARYLDATEEVFVVRWQLKRAARKVCKAMKACGIESLDDLDGCQDQALKDDVGRFLRSERARRASGSQG
jgi:hypothetical protein